jgi:diamine N-acetyltransferase
VQACSSRIIACAWSETATGGLNTAWPFLFLNKTTNTKEQHSMEQPIINLMGEQVALGPFHRDLAPLFLKWMNDFEVTSPYGAHFRTWTLEAQEQNYARCSPGGTDYVDFTIYEQVTLRPIGRTSLEGIDYVNRTAKFVILIGEKECWNKGYGTETTTLMLDYGFTGLGLHNIWLTVFSFNGRGIRAYQRAGFKAIGRWREAHRLGGRAYDVIYMDCLATEFQSPVLHQWLPAE